MTSLFPPFNRRQAFRKLPYYYEAGRGPYTRSLGGPALSLDFTSGTLDPRVTFSRPSNATYYDSTGKLTYAPNNMILGSQKYDDVTWTKTNTTVTAPSLTAPDGTLTATKVSETNSTFVHNINQLISSFTTGNVYIFSIYAKQDERRYLAFNSSSAVFSSNEFATFDLQAGTVTQIGSAVLASGITSVGNGWYRCFVKIAAISTASAGAAWGPTDGPTNGRAYIYTGITGYGLLLWGAQTELVTYQVVPGAYNLTTSAQYFGPRFDYDPATLAARGLLIEEARTNRLSPSNAFTSNWTFTSATVTASAGVSPDGTSNANLLIPSNATAQHFTSNNVFVSSTGATAVSVFVKAKEYSRIVVYMDDTAGTSIAYAFDLNTLSVTSTRATPASWSSPSASIISVGNSWYRLSVSGTWTGAASSFGLRLSPYPAGSTFDGFGLPVAYAANGTDAIFVYGAQMENGAFATSYIPTAASSVARSADFATIPAAGSLDGPEWTAIWSGYVNGGAPGSGTSFLADVGSPFDVYLYANPTPVFGSFDAGTSSFLGDGPLLLNAFQKGAVARSLSGRAICGNGTVPVSDSAVLGVSSTVSLAGANSRTISALQVYRTRLPNATLQALTAPNLAAALALDLDFTTGVLDPRITFSRTSNATFVDSTGNVTYAPNNIVTQSNTFSTWTIVKGATGTVVVTPNYTTDPFGGNTASRLQMASNSDFAVLQRFFGVLNVRQIHSVWIKSNTSSNQSVILSGYGTVVATPEWQRLFVIGSGSADVFYFTPAISTLDISVYGAQAELVTYQTQPRTYNPTTAAAYYGPRFTYDPVSLQPLGLLIEEQRTNLALQSGSMSVSPWTTFGGVTATANAGTAPDGTNSATLLTTNNPNHNWLQLINVSASTAYTFSFWVKRGTMNELRYSVFDVSNSSNIVAPTSYYSQTNGSTYTRVSLTFTTPVGCTSINVYPIRDSLSTGTVYVWGAQLEAGSLATSYIPTTTGSLTRNADSATMTGTNFSSWYNAAQGTFVAQYNSPLLGPYGVFSANQSGAETTNRIDMRTTGASVITSNGTSITVTASNTAGARKQAVAYATANFAVVQNGGTVATQTSGSVPVGVNQIRIGTLENGSNPLSGTINRLSFYNVRAADFQLQQMTQ